MAKLNEHNEYPRIMYPTPDMPPDPTLAFTQEQMLELERQGWMHNPIRRDYPKLIPTGEFKKVKSQWDEGITELPVKAQVNNEQEEKALLARLNKQVSAPVSRGPGRPAKQVEETTAA